MAKLTAKELNDRFIEKLSASGITIKQAKKLNFQVLTAEAATKLQVKPYAGFKIPYFDIKGKETKFYRVRYLEDTKVGFAQQTNAKPQRYSQPPDTLNEAYLPPVMDWVEFASSNAPLIITEGELKAAAATLRGFPTLGLGGVDCFRSARRGIGLLPVFSHLGLAGRKVFIIYDSDAATNPHVAAAESVLCRELSTLGAVPHIIRLPNTLPSGKTGLDDYLLQTSDEDFALLLQSALEHPYQLAAELHKLNEEVIVVHNPVMVYEVKTGNKISPHNFKEFNYATRWFYQRITSADGEVKLKKVSAPAEWIKWEHRAAVQRVVYEPGQPKITQDNNLNMWQGWPYEPTPGDISPWAELLDFIFKGDTESRKWFEQWAAYPLQNPGAKLFSAVVVWGIATGTGKTLIGYTLMKLYGENAIEIHNEDLENPDNDYAENKQFVVGEEITGGDKRGLADRLKSLITRETVRINIKYVAKYTIRDCINYYFTSNHPDAFYIDRNDRRFFIHEVGGEPLRKDFYTRYDRWYKSTEGLSGLFAHLLSLDLTGFDPTGRAPMTESKQAMIGNGQSELDAWVTALADDPATVLRVNGNKLSYDLYRAEELLNLFAPGDAHTRVTPTGLARALARGGFKKPNGEQGCRTAAGQYKLWVVRNAARYAGLSGIELGKCYDDERALKQPKFAATTKRENNK